MRVLFLLGSVFFAFAGWGISSATAQPYPSYDALEIRLNSITNRGFWFDVEIGLGARPDFQATVTVVDEAGERIIQCVSPRYENMESVSPNHLLCGRPLTVKKPYSIIVHLVDHDARDDSEQQTADLDLTNASMDFIGPTIYETVPLQVIATPGDVVVVLTVMAKPVTPTVRFDGITAPATNSASVPFFDPEAGEALDLYGAITPGGGVWVNVKPKYPELFTVEQAQKVLSFTGVWLGNFKGSFNAKFSGILIDYFACCGRPPAIILPPGVYTAALQYASPDSQAVLSASHEFEVREISRAQLSSWSFPKRLDINAEPFSISFASTENGIAYVDIFSDSWGSSECRTGFMGLSPEEDPSDTHFTESILRGQNKISWSGIVSYGSLAPGNYCIAVRAKTADGRDFAGSLYDSFTVSVPPLPRLVVTAQPVAPVIFPRAGMVEATAIDEAFRPVPAKRIELYVGSYSGPGSPAPQLATVCTGVSRCQAPIHRNFGTVVYEARISNTRGDYTTGLRLTDVQRDRWVTTYRVSAAAEYLPDNPTAIGETDRTKTIDVVFHAGDGYALENEAGRGIFLKRIQTEIWTLLGLSNPTQSTVFNNFGNVSFFMSTVPAQVTQAGLNFGACLRTVGGLESFADVNAVLHPGLNCRDYASGSIYTAKDAKTSWHEFHHIAYGLADEYCKFTFHHVPSQFPNLYGSLDQCRELSSNPATCKSIADPANCPPGDTCECNGSFYKSDPGIAGVADYDDVMGDRISERADDLRAAQGKFASCRRGRC